MKPRPSYSFSAELPSSSDTTSHSASHRSPGRHAIKLRLLQLHSSFLAIQSGQLQVTVCSASPHCLLPPQHLVVIYLPCRLFFFLPDPTAQPAVRRPPSCPASSQWVRSQQRVSSPCPQAITLCPRSPLSGRWEALLCSYKLRTASPTQDLRQGFIPSEPLSRLIPPLSEQQPFLLGSLISPLFWQCYPKSSRGWTSTGIETSPWVPNIPCWRG